MVSFLLFIIAEFHGFHVLSEHYSLSSHSDEYIHYIFPLVIILDLRQHDTDILYMLYDYSYIYQFIDEDTINLFSLNTYNLIEFSYIYIV